MTPDASLRILLVVEDRADASAVAALIDKVLLEDETRADWVDAALLPALRAWISLNTGRSSDTPHATWTEIKREGPRVLGHGLHGPTRHPYAAAARRAVQAASLATARPNAVVLVVDADAEQTRRQGLDEGRRADQTSLTVVIGVADPKREAWILNAFVPENEEELLDVAEAQMISGIDCLGDAHRLRGARGDDRDIKRALALVTSHSVERELRALRSAPLAALRTNGVHTGLTAFLDEARVLCERIGARDAAR